MAMPSADSVRTMSSSLSVSDWVSDEVGSSMKITFASPGQRPGDGDDLALGDGEGAQRCIDVEVGAEPREQSCALFRAWRHGSTRRGIAPSTARMPIFSATLISGNSARSCQMTSTPAARAAAGDIVSIGLPAKDNCAPGTAGRCR